MTFTAVVSAALNASAIEAWTKRWSGRTQVCPSDSVRIRSEVGASGAKLNKVRIMGSGVGPALVKAPHAMRLAATVMSTLVPGLRLGLGLVLGLGAE